MAALNAGVAIRCNLPTDRGEESTDIVVFEQGNNIIYILATTAPNDISLSFSPKMDPGSFTVWPQHISPERAKDIVLWATKWVKDMHIRSKCVLGGEMERMRELILSIASVAFIHPSAIYGEDTLVSPASIKSVDSSSQGTGTVTVRLRSDMQQPTPPESSSPVSVIQARQASIIVWSCPMHSPSREMLLVPYPHTEGRTMNSTVMVLGDLVHKQTTTLYTYSVPVDHDGFAKMMDNVNPSRATVTYFPECQGNNLPHGVHFPTPVVGGLAEGRCVVLLNGTKCVDNTSLGLVRFAEYNGMSVPLVCGCAVRDSFKYERAHIPLVFLPITISSVRFEDVSFGRIRLFVDDAFRGDIAVSKKEKHGTTWWVTLAR